MPLQTSWPMTSSFAGVPSLQANGTQTTGTSSPSGIDGRLEIVRDPTGVRGNVMRSTLYESDDNTAGYRRSEIAGPADSLAEYWYSWSMMIDPVWTDLENPFILAQIHDTPDGGDGQKAPNFLLANLSGHLRCTVPEQTLPSEGGNLRRIGTAPLIPGRWFDCCLHAKWATGTGGMREFFVDGMPMFREINLPTQYTDVTGPYLKLGIYNGLSATAGWVMRRAYYSDVRIWSGDATYEQGLNRQIAQPIRVTSL